MEKGNYREPRLTSTEVEPPKVKPMMGKANQTVADVSPRALIIGLSLAVTECLIAPYNDYVIRNTFLAGGHFPLGPFFVLTVLTLVVNSSLRLFSPKLALSSRELITIW